jgi:hypothetical protein
MSPNTTLTHILPTFALTVMLAATGCAAVTDHADVSSVASGVNNDDTEFSLDIDEQAPQHADHTAADDTSVAGHGDHTLTLGPGVPGGGDEPQQALPLTADYLRTLVAQIRYATPSHMVPVDEADFLSFDIAGMVDLADGDAEPVASPLYSYDAAARLLEISFWADDNSHKGTMTCDVDESQSAAAHERFFSCNFTIQNGEGELAGRLDMSHELLSDSLRVVLDAKDYRPIGATEVTAWYYIQQASETCRNVASNQRIKTPNSIEYHAEMTDVVQCDNRCQPESGRIAFSIATAADARNFTLSASSGEEWLLVDSAAGDSTVKACH